jgi:hypothetical protein
LRQMSWQDLAGMREFPAAASLFFIF